MPASSEDHIVPVSILAMIDGLTQEVRAEILGQLPPLIKVYSCHQCNSVLGNRFFRTLSDRRVAVKSYLKRKYARLLEMPAWDEEELSELGYGLQKFVRNRIRLKNEIEERLRWRR
jgi:hypothetical protein